jgi:carboxyl-terminal processing protease
MATNFKAAALLVTGTILGASITLSQGVFADRESNPASLPLQELQAFAEILSQVKDNYVEPVEDKVLLENAIRGMLDGLDPHSAYLDNEEYSEISISTSGKFGGLGIEVQMFNGFVRVVSPIDDTPASRAGVEAGDLIIRIDDKPVKGLSLTDAVRLMRGKPGTTIDLMIMRDGRPQPFNLELTRAIIKVQSVRSRMLEPHYGYVRISTFSGNTAAALGVELKKLQKESDTPLNGLILDLRNNPGGVLTAAVDVSDAFLDSGAIVSIKGRHTNSDREFTAKPGDALYGKPLVVLVNEGSASASEIVAGALQDHQRGVIVGRKTFGKGSVQTIVPVRNNAAIKLTTARYYTPNGRSIQATGIEPDVTIRSLQVSQREPGYVPVKEADLTNSLKNENGKTATAGDANPAEEASLAESDYALYEALNLLKGLSIMNMAKK